MRYWLLALAAECETMHGVMPAYYVKGFALQCYSLNSETCPVVPANYLHML